MAQAGLLSSQLSVVTIDGVAGVEDRIRIGDEGMRGIILVDVLRSAVRGTIDPSEGVIIDVRQRGAVAVLVLDEVAVGEQRVRARRDGGFGSYW